MSTKSSRFLELPPEIRLLIYRYALAPTGYLLTIMHHYREGSAFKRRFELVPGIPFKMPAVDWALPLLQTCRLINTEARNVLYESNIFSIDLGPAFNRMGGDLRLIQHIWCRLSLGRSNFNAVAEYFRFLGNWKGEGSMLRFFTLNLSYEEYKTWVLFKNRPRCSVHASSVDELFRKLRGAWLDAFLGTDVRLNIEVWDISPRSDATKELVSPSEIFVCLSSVLAGELWSGHKLCYKHSKCLLQPPEVGDRAWRVRWVPEEQRGPEPFQLT